MVFPALAATAGGAAGAVLKRPGKAGAMIYFEDLEVGRETEYGSYEVTREEVLEFARKYDPQPFHLSDEAAARTHFGRLAARSRPASARPGSTSCAGSSPSIRATL